MATSYVIGGRRINSSIYGIDFESEYRRLVKTYLKPVTGHVLEWGAGLTSIMMSEYVQNAKDIKTFDTIESDKKYFEAVREALSSFKKTSIHFKDVNGPCESMQDKGLNYSTFPLSLQKNFDFVFIDGRRRLECALVSSLIVHRDSVIVIHDYRRTRYQPILALFDLVEDGTQFRVLRPNSMFLAYTESRRHLYLPSFLEFRF